MKTSLRILVADDNDEVRGILRAILKDQAAMKVIAEARTGHEVVDLVRIHKPDVVLMDVEMPGLDGFQALQRIMQDWGDTKVIMVTRQTSRVAVKRAQRLGARGYVAKQDLHAELVSALQTLADGGAYLSKAVGGSSSRVCSGGVDAAKQDRATLSQKGDVAPSHTQEGRRNAHSNEETPIHNLIRVFLVDDEEMVGTVVAQSLHDDPRFHFVGVGYDDEIVVRVLSKEQPDIVLLDIVLGDQARGGWCMMERIRQVCPDAGIIILARSIHRADVSEAWKCGAAGYLNKVDWGRDGIQAMLSVYAGKRFFPALGEQNRNRECVTKDLSKTERDVYDRYVRDVPPQATAQERKIEVATVYVHKTHIEDKIGHLDGWKGIAKDAQKDPGLLCELSDKERRVFDLYIQGQHILGTKAIQDIATNLFCSEVEVTGLMRNIRRKLNCHPDGWKGIAREEGDID